MKLFLAVDSGAISDDLSEASTMGLALMQPGFFEEMS
jgi:hypothetical protein